MQMYSSSEVASTFSPRHRAAPPLHIPEKHKLKHLEGTNPVQTCTSVIVQLKAKHRENMAIPISNQALAQENAASTWVRDKTYV